MMMFIYGMLVMSAITTVSLWFPDDADIVKVLCGGPIAWMSALFCLIINYILYGQKRKR